MPKERIAKKEKTEDAAAPPPSAAPKADKKRRKPETPVKAEPGATKVKATGNPHDRFSFMNIDVSKLVLRHVGGKQPLGAMLAVQEGTGPMAEIKDLKIRLPPAVVKWVHLVAGGAANFKNEKGKGRDMHPYLDGREMTFNATYGAVPDKVAETLPDFLTQHKAAAEKLFEIIERAKELMLQSGKARPGLYRRVYEEVFEEEKEGFDNAKDRKVAEQKAQEKADRRARIAFFEKLHGPLMQEDEETGEKKFSIKFGRRAFWRKKEYQGLTQDQIIAAEEQLGLVADPDHLTHADIMKFTGDNGLYDLQEVKYFGADGKTPKGKSELMRDITTKIVGDGDMINFLFTVKVYAASPGFGGKDEHPAGMMGIKFIFEPWHIDIHARKDQVGEFTADVGSGSSGGSAAVPAESYGLEGAFGDVADAAPNNFGTGASASSSSAGAGYGDNSFGQDGYGANNFA